MELIVNGEGLRLVLHWSFLVMSVFVTVLAGAVYVRWKRDDHYDD